LAELDRVIHEPARLRILTVLSGVDMADFNFLLTALGLTKGNLSAHMDRLEREGYVRVDKRFEGKLPRTEYRLTDAGRTALREYWREIDRIRTLAPVR
jgi:DNA-binding transcriptional ArsR family regulator